LASPYGYTEAGRHFMYQILIPYLKEIGYEVLNPWNLSAHENKKNCETLDLSYYNASARAIHQLKKENKNIGARNEKAIRDTDLVIAVLDGQEIDSGVAAEVGFAYGIGKKIIGYRGDFRIAGENIGLKVNLQLQSFIENSRGIIVTSLEELKRLLERFNN
jgi:nucleoside 2-deoxyribosyltransferase